MVSAIALIELPRHEWDKLLDILVANAQGPNIEYKLASLETLGYICEELENNSISVAQVDAVLSALVSNVMPQIENENVKMSALTALTHVIRFCEKNFRVEAEKDAIVTNILANYISPNVDIRKMTMQCIIEIVRYFYDYIGGKTLDQIGIATFNDIRKDTEEEVPLLAIEVWCSICDEEIERTKAFDPDHPEKPCRDYIKTAYEGLRILLLECLKRKSSSDNNDWNISVAASCCLNLVANIVKDAIAEPVLAYVSENIGSADWKCRDAALLSFAAILKGPQRTTLNNLVQQALDTLIAMLKDPKEQVRETSAWLLARIADQHFDALMESLALQKVIAGVLPALKDRSRVSNQACFVLHNLAEWLKPAEADNSCSLSPYFKDILGALWENGFRKDANEDNINLSNSSFSTLSTVIQNSAPDVQPVVAQIAQMFVENFDSTMRPDFRLPARAQEFQGYFCSAMQTAFLKLAGKLPLPLATHVFDSIIESFQKRQAVYEEAIVTVDGLITATGESFLPQMPRFGPYLVHALKSTDDVSLCRAAVCCIGAMPHAFGQNLAPYLGEIVPILMDILKGQDIDRSLKLSIINALSDLALQMGRAFFPYLKEVLDMLKTAAEMSLQPTIEDDPDLPDYVQKLKENIMECYTGITFGLKEAGDTGIFDAYLTGVFGYMNRLCGDGGEIQVDVDFLKTVVGLIGDLADLYGTRLQMLLTQSFPFVQRAISVLEKCTSKEHRLVAQWARVSLDKALGHMNNKK